MTVEPIHCRREAFELLESWADRIETPSGLLVGAVAISMHEMPDTTIEAVEERIDAIVADIRARFASDSTSATLAHAHQVLFDEMGFSGVVGDHDPKDSYLPAVLDRRRGLPISLALVYRLVLERLGVIVHGLNAPAHFLAGAETEGSIMIVDCAANGRVLTMPEVAQRVLQHTESSLLSRANPLPVATTTEWLRRMLRNLMSVFGTRNQPSEFGAMLELKALLD